MTTEKYDDKINEINFYCDMCVRTLGFIEGQVTRHNDEQTLNLIQMHADGMKGILKLLVEYKGNIISLNEWQENKENKENKDNKKGG